MLCCDLIPGCGEAGFGVKLGFGFVRVVVPPLFIGDAAKAVEAVRISSIIKTVFFMLLIVTQNSMFFTCFVEEMLILP